MPRKSANKGKASTAASKTVAGPSGGTSGSQALMSSSRFFGANSSMGCAPPIVPPPSVLPSPLLEAAIPSTSGLTVDRAVEQLILDLIDRDRRENALVELCVRIEQVQDLARLIWFSFGTMAILLQEVNSVNPLVSPPSLTPQHSKRVCNVLLLLECVASHPETRVLFAKACIPYYLIVLLNQIGEFGPFECIRVSTLRVIAALLKVLDTNVVSFLLYSEVIPPCLCAIQRGSEFSRTVATFILQRLLLDNEGLQYVCCNSERLFSVCQALGNVFALLSRESPGPPLRNVIRCYLRILDDERSLLAVRHSLPRSLIDGMLDHCLREDQSTRVLLQQLIVRARVPLVAKKDCLSNSTRYIDIVNAPFSSVAIDSVWLKVSKINIIRKVTVTMESLILLILVNFIRWLD